MGFFFGLYLLSCQPDFLKTERREDTLVPVMVVLENTENILVVVVTPEDNITTESCSINIIQVTLVKLVCDTSTKLKTNSTAQLLTSILSGLWFPNKPAKTLSKKLMEIRSQSLMLPVLVTSRF